MVQLHGDEGPPFCAEVARRTGAKVIKAARVRGNGRHPRARDASTPTTTCSTPTAPGMRGGTGETFDWALVRSRRSTIPLDAQRRAERRRTSPRRSPRVRPFAVDTASGTEARPGVKDPEKLTRLRRGGRATATRVEVEPPA